MRDAILGALTGSQRALASVRGRARRYPTEVAPFAALEDRSSEAMRDLYDLLLPGETVYLLGSEPPAFPGLQHAGTLPCLQMIWPEAMPLPPRSPDAAVEALDCSHAAEMVELIEIAYPGFFRLGTCRMGRYFGVRDPDGQLIAMCGERLVVGRYREVSGLCTHPAHVGRGLGATVMRGVLAVQLGEGSVPFLHVADSNTLAIAMYLRLGFKVLRRTHLHRILRLAQG